MINLGYCIVYVIYLSMFVIAHNGFHVSFELLVFVGLSAIIARQTTLGD